MKGCLARQSELRPMLKPKLRIICNYARILLIGEPRMLETNIRGSLGAVIQDAIALWEPCS